MHEANGSETSDVRSHTSHIYIYIYTSFPLNMRLGMGALDGRSVWKPDPPVVLPDMVLLRQSVCRVERVEGSMGGQQ